MALTESGSGTLAGSAYEEAFRQVARADAVMVAEALQRDFDKPLLDAAFPGWPVEAGFELRMEEAEKFVSALVGKLKDELRTEG